MAKVAFFNVDEKEQDILLEVFVGEKSFELSFNQKSLDIYTATLAKEALERILITSAENFKAYFRGHPQNIVANLS